MKIIFTEYHNLSMEIAKYLEGEVAFDTMTEMLKEGHSKGIKLTTNFDVSPDQAHHLMKEIMERGAPDS